MGTVTCTIILKSKANASIKLNGKKLLHSSKIKYLIYLDEILMGTKHWGSCSKIKWSKQDFSQNKALCPP